LRYLNIGVERDPRGHGTNLCRFEPLFVLKALICSSLRCRSYPKLAGTIFGNHRGGGLNDVRGEFAFDFDIEIRRRNDGMARAKSDGKRNLAQLMRTIVEPTAAGLWARFTREAK
jgi:hypothetical protein